MMYLACPECERMSTDTTKREFSSTGGAGFLSVYRIIDHLTDSHSADSDHSLSKPPPRAEFVCGQCPADGKTLDEIASHCIQSGHRATGVQRNPDRSLWILSMLKRIEQIFQAGTEMYERLITNNDGEKIELSNENDNESGEEEKESSYLSSNDDYQEYLNGEIVASLEEDERSSAEPDEQADELTDYRPSGSDPSQSISTDDKSTGSKKKRKRDRRKNKSANQPKIDNESHEQQQSPPAITTSLITAPEMLEQIKELERERPRETERDYGVRRDPTDQLYHCSTCSVTYRKANELIRHIRKHTGERPFRCPICPQLTFRLKASRTDHVISHHTKAYPLRCDGCGRGYSRVKQLAAHLAAGRRNPAKCTGRQQRKSSLSTNNASGLNRDESSSSSTTTIMELYNITPAPPPAKLEDWNRPWRRT